MNLGFLLYEGLTQLDMSGPYEVLARLPGADVHLVAKTLAPVHDGVAMAVVPTTTFADCPPLDVLVVPGGFGCGAAIADDELLGFVRRQGGRAKWVTAVCTGSLVLGAAGLLEGYAATTHWAYVDLLPLVGARPAEGRVVVDRDRVTAGGVTAGIDFGLRLAAEIAGQACAERIQLALEYDPEPPFASGHPRVAPPDHVRALREGRFAPRVAALGEALLEARRRSARAVNETG